MDRNPIDVHVGQRIREIRRGRSLTQAELAAAIDTTYQQVQKYETALNRVSASQLWKIAGHFSVDVGTFFPDCEYDGSDEALIARLARLPPHLITIIGDLAEAIGAVKRTASDRTNPSTPTSIAADRGAFRKAQD